MRIGLLTPLYCHAGGGASSATAANTTAQATAGLQA